MNGSMRAILVAIGLALASVACASAQQGQPAGEPAHALAPPPGAATQPADTGGRLELSPTELDFGQVWVGAKVSQEFTVRNTGTGPLTISVQTPCGCTPVTQPKSPLPAGETTTFTVAYTTNYRSVANKKVTVTTNDPAHAQVLIPVRGEVRPLYELKPAAVTFTDLDPDARQTLTIALENKFDRPLPLRLKEGQELGKFEAELKEIEAGQKYELIVSTRPPLGEGRHGTTVVLETGVADLPAVSVPVTGFVPRPVVVTPPRLYISPTTTQPRDWLLSVEYRKDRPLKITGVKVTPESITYEVLPGSVRGARQSQQIRLRIPDYSSLPDGGGQVEILTDDPAPEFARLVVPIVKQIVRPRGTPPAAGPAAAHPASQPAAPAGQRATEDEVRRRIQEALAKRAGGEGQPAEKPKSDQPAEQPAE